MNIHDYAQLKTIIEREMKGYPHGEPNPETVEAIAQGLLAVLAVSNARPAKYASEPWLQQPAKTHAAHANDHAFAAFEACDPETGAPWFTDLMQPEIAHCCMRSMLCLYQYARGRIT